jgi:hypothetical protein
MSVSPEFDIFIKFQNNDYVITDMTVIFENYKTDKKQLRNKPEISKLKYFKIIDKILLSSLLNDSTDYLFVLFTAFITNHWF